MLADIKFVGGTYFGTSQSAVSNLKDTAIEVNIFLNETIHRMKELFLNIKHLSKSDLLLLLKPLSICRTFNKIRGKITSEIIQSTSKVITFLLLCPSVCANRWKLKPMRYVKFQWMKFECMNTAARGSSGCKEQINLHSTQTKILLMLL
jgi:hypothetical protein